jgi:chromatin structure-remodeling complex protein RSC7
VLILLDGKWVTDDYYEDESLAKCAENGYTPYAPAIDEEILGHANGAQTRGERERDALISSAATKTNVLSPFYTIGGPSTHFGGAGIDPWTDGGHGNKHARMKSIGVHAEDWMYRTARECRNIDAGLRRYREERIGMLEGRDLDGWVWTAESASEQPAATDQVDGSPEKGTREEVSGLGPNTGLKPPTMERQRSGLSREVTFEPEPGLEAEQGPAKEADVSMDNLEVKGAGIGEDDNDTTALTPLPENDGIDHENRKVIGGELRVETPAEAEVRKQKWSYGAGQWEQGTIMASYEVCLSLFI